MLDRDYLGAGGAQYLRGDAARVSRSDEAFVTDPITHGADRRPPRNASPHGKLFWEV